MNSLVTDHLPATYFAEYQSLRQELLEILTDGDLATDLGGDTATLGTDGKRGSARRASYRY